MPNSSMSLRRHHAIVACVDPAGDATGNFKGSIQMSTAMKRAVDMWFPKLDDFRRRRRTGFENSSGQVALRKIPSLSMRPVQMPPEV